MFLIFLSAFTVGLSGSMMPGPLLTYTVQKSLSAGQRAGFIITAGHAVLEALLIAVIFLGFDAVLKSDTAQILIGAVGGILLSVMGLGMIRNAVKNKVTVTVETAKEKSGGMLASGFAISAANPYFLLWWAMIGLGFLLRAYEAFGVWGIALFYFGHIAADFMWYGVISVVVGKTRRFIRQTPYRVIIAGLGTVVVVFGIDFLIGAWRTVSAL